jgi:hypothetical protein
VKRDSGVKLRAALRIAPQKQEISVNQGQVRSASHRTRRSKSLPRVMWKWRLDAAEAD